MPATRSWNCVVRDREVGKDVLGDRGRQRTVVASSARPGQGQIVVDAVKFTSSDVSIASAIAAAINSTKRQRVTWSVPVRPSDLDSVRTRILALRRRREDAIGWDALFVVDATTVPAE